MTTYEIWKRLEGKDRPLVTLFRGKPITDPKHARRVARMHGGHVIEFPKENF
jgi:hypothetical protein